MRLIHAVSLVGMLLDAKRRKAGGSYDVFVYFASRFRIILGNIPGKNIGGFI